MAAVPEVEARFWKKIGASVALNLLIKTGGLKVKKNHVCYVNAIAFSRRLIWTKKKQGFLNQLYDLYGQEQKCSG